MWSRPIRIALVKICRRPACGAAARSSHTDDACVIVTSLSTPRPASTMLQASSPWKSRPPPANVERVPPVSSAMPVRWAWPMATLPIRAVSPMPTRVPASAVLVRSDQPCVV